MLPAGSDRSGVRRVLSLWVLVWVLGLVPLEAGELEGGPVPSRGPQARGAAESLRSALASGGGALSRRQELLKSVLLSTALPNELLPRQILPEGASRPKPLSQKQINAARKRLRLQTTTVPLSRPSLEPLPSHPPSLLPPTDPPTTHRPRLLGETIAMMTEAKPTKGAAPTPHTNQPQPSGAPPSRGLPLNSTAETRGVEEEEEEEGGQESNTSTIILTTVISTENPPVACSVNFSDPEGYIDSTDYPPLPLYAYQECTYNVAVYTGYGVELQVKSVNLSEGEQLSIRGVEEGGALLVLANETLLVEGQVIRSPTNTISVFFRTFLEGGMGTFQLHYQIFLLSCALPRRPHYGEVAVMDLHPGGMAHFHCHLGYQLQGEGTLVCLNDSRPRWSSKVPSCKALCGGAVRNASIGRVLSPNHPGNYSNNLNCSWTLEATGVQKVHLHFERLALAGKGDRVLVLSGTGDNSTVLFDSAHGGLVPFEGVISEGQSVLVQFTSDTEHTATGFNIRYEAFERGHCYEPYLQNGNFTTSDPSYNVGTIVEFTCEAGHSLEQGPPVIECINLRDPYWNDTEPVCKALCGGELSAPSGLILSPNWPDTYGEGEDCSWRIHVGEERRILLDIHLLNLSNSDIMTIYDGDEVTTRILGQYIGGTSPFKLYSSTPDLTVQFHSDPAGMVFGKGEGFVINYMEVSQNDSCSDLPEIQNGWKTTSHMELVRGARITYQCDPGYDIVGSETLTCQWDLVWSSQPPFCEKIMYCTDPGQVEHSSRTLSDPKLLVGTTIQYTCTPGYILEGGAMLTCYGRETGTPVWTSRLPRCSSEESVSCENPGLPENGYQILYKHLYLPGESLTFMCYEGFELIGEITIKCVRGNPSYWSGPLPLCRENQESFEHTLEVAEAAAESSLDGGNMALAIFIPVLILSVLLGGAYVYITRCRYHSNLRLPLMYTHPYSQITVETEFDNPIYETGDTREYEVSI
ncbi:seizure 6-like protein [Polyodon spathula]|uniref:seizure 6-like protein n=1 Tax=Polyodon spathula TaxID=7913 RepID=UPI001B7F2C59|nr:seizure 6-like protein [Polyodon spathula]